MANDVLRNVEDKMRKAAEGLKKELVTIRTGHASVALVEHLKVDYAGVPTPLIQMAGISAPEARLLVIQTWDNSVMRNIEKAILASAGSTPTMMGTSFNQYRPLRRAPPGTHEGGQAGRRKKGRHS
jgi:ribosome recycling factor